MQYVLEILQDRLCSERQARGQAKEWLRGSGIDGRNRDDVRAFEESLSLANKRIPQLEEAIECISLGMIETFSNSGLAITIAKSRHIGDTLK